MNKEDIIQDLSFMYEHISDKDYIQSTGACVMTSLAMLERLLSDRIGVFNYIRNTISESQSTIFKAAVEHIEKEDELFIEVLKDYRTYIDTKAATIYSVCTKNINNNSHCLKDDDYKKVLEIIKNMSFFAAENIYFALNERYNLT